MISENKFIYALWVADSADVGIEFSKKEAQELARMIDGYLSRIAKLEELIDRLVEIGDWATIGMVISSSFSSSSEICKLAETRRNKWEMLLKDWKERVE